MRQKPLYWAQQSVGIATEQDELKAPLWVAIQEWNEVECGQLRLHWDSASENRVHLRSPADWKYSQNVLAMTTQVYFGNPHIYRNATIEVNQKNHLWTFVDYKNVLLHELGHVLGLEHSDNLLAVMHPNGQLGDEERFLLEEDRNAYCELHPLNDQILERQVLPGTSSCSQILPLSTVWGDACLICGLLMAFCFRKNRSRLRTF
ncbi:MAG: matrixin family metalloprotease [Myxococcaceae bacterium]|nr:matrixin family metalloprotease [Myxococcaceae bacterium]MBH2006338.1 matrixin family metalloprotease [Myxococcaceae bacterium]